MNMNKMMIATGIVLIIIAIILGSIQHFSIYNIYGNPDYKWYFYGLVGVIGLIGIVLAIWAYIKK